MAAVTAVIENGNKDGNLQFGEQVNKIKTYFWETASTVDAGDTIAFDMEQLGMTTLLAVEGFKHTTDDSVIVEEAHTTEVSGTTLTVTIPAGTDDDKRLGIIYYL